MPGLLAAVRLWKHLLASKKNEFKDIQKKFSHLSHRTCFEAESAAACAAVFCPGSALEEASVINTLVIPSNMCPIKSIGFPWVTHPNKHHKQLEISRSVES